MGFTTIQISSGTRERLTRLKVSRRETYDEVLNALLDLVPTKDDEGEYTDEFRASLLRGMADIRHGRLLTQDELKKRLGIR